ncbi:MAG: peptidoglycan-binding protein, partial [Deltaproteobacteria bacterium]|nr:peptidoglycan-binding protein [Deltaproteobacteria bacterium]
MTVDRVIGSSQPSRSASALHRGYTAAPSISAASHGDCIKKGHEGASVKTVQHLLNAAGAHPPLAEDGMFGPKTDRAVRQFQASHGLKANGQVGPQMLKALQAGGSVEGEVTLRNRTAATAATGGSSPAAAPQAATGSTRALNTARGLADAAPLSTAPTDQAAATPNYAPAPGRASRSFCSDPAARLEQAEQLMRANGQWPPQEGRRYAIQIDQDTPGADASRQDRAAFLGSYTGEIAVFRGSNGGLVEEMAPAPAAAHPNEMSSNQSPDVNGDGDGDVANLRPGAYEYQTSKTSNNRFNPVGALPVDRDLNHNGVIDGGAEQGGFEAYGIQIHQGQKNRPSSIGCQTMPPGVFGEFSDTVSRSAGGEFTYILARRPNDASPQAAPVTATGSGSPAGSQQPAAVAPNPPAQQPAPANATPVAPISASPGSMPDALTNLPTIDLKKGDKREEVGQLKSALAELGFISSKDPTLNNNTFDETTRKALQKFQ